MEVIRIPGYTEDEKLNIAMRYLLPKQMEQHGLKADEIRSARRAADIIRYYTRESGVRNLEREIAKICRKAVKQLALDKDQDKVTCHPQPGSFLGVQRFRYGVVDEKNEIGQVTGLAWTEVGGELLKIEATLVPGKGNLTLTGHLGDVMKESIQAAMTVVRSRAEHLGSSRFLPEARCPRARARRRHAQRRAVAGIAMCTALVSSLSRIPVRANVAMTGEITLRGKVLPIGGLKEKLLAAHRGGIDTVIIPEENEKDLVDIPKVILKKLEIHPVRPSTRCWNWR